MQGFFSSFLIALGQTAAVLIYLMYGEADAFLARRERPVLPVVFCLLLSFVQASLHGYISGGGMGSMPTLPFLAACWLLYTLFVFLWSRGKWEVCCFVAFILLLADNCIWPLIGGLSRSIWGINYLYEGSFLLRLPFILLLSVLECVLVFFLRRLLPELSKIHLSLYDAVLAATIVLPFLYIRSLAGQSLSQSNKTVQILMTLCCLIAVITLAARIGRSSGEYEKLREMQMQNILSRQQAMFEQKLSDADLLNRKYHDMKNYLLYLRSGDHSGDLDAAIDHLMDSITPYGSSVTTGNSVLDVILNEKLSLCAQKEIVCVPYVDGSLFSFVRPLDLCTLVGNAMDNAIESCSQIPETDRRIIRLHSTQRSSTVFFTVRNTFRQKPDLRNGLPASTKSDAANHGYGLRNMRYIAEQYGGALSCRLEGEEFVLSIVLDSSESGETS